MNLKLFITHFIRITRQFVSSINSLQFLKLVLVFLIALFCSCKQADDGEKMRLIIKEFNNNFKDKNNPFDIDEAILKNKSRLEAILSTEDKLEAEFVLGNNFLRKGLDQDAIFALNDAAGNIGDTENSNFDLYIRALALAHLRLGLRQNNNPVYNPESYIFPIQSTGILKNQSSPKNAINVLKNYQINYPIDYDALWLLNLIFMTTGGYPTDVPEKFLIPDLDKNSSDISVQAFKDCAIACGIKLQNNAGGVILEDMNHDGYLDIITSDCSIGKSLHYFQNDQSGGFTDLTEKSGLSKVAGGINLLVADYDNDGDPDIFVLRGAWWGTFGKEANSLLRNNGDGTFTDVTISSGLLSMHPTQTGVWADFNNDGWLDLFIGNETTNKTYPEPCELFINNRNGTFTEVAQTAGCKIIDYVKGVTATDYDNDGLTDLFISSNNPLANRILLKNTGIKNGIPQFKDVSQQAGLRDIQIRTSCCWFWDYNNDGWPDLFVCGNEPDVTMMRTACLDALHLPNKSSTMYLYRNNKDGTFTNITKESGLNKPAFSMGANFGDIDNDGNLDFYLGTGGVELNSLLPNRLFKNMGNETFTEITNAARVGNLQKGQGVAIADIDNDGNQDIFVESGGLYPSESNFNSLYINPGQNRNNWISIRLIGKKTNRSAIGSRVKLSFTENGIQKTIYRDVNTGGSFGCSTLRREIGIGQAAIIDEIEIRWQKNQNIQKFKNVKPNQFITIEEGEDELKVNSLKNLEMIKRFKSSN